MGCLTCKISEFFSRAKPFQILAAAHLNSNGLSLPIISSCLALHCQSLRGQCSRPWPLFLLVRYSILTQQRPQLSHPPQESAETTFQRDHSQDCTKPLLGEGCLSHQAEATPVGKGQQDQGEKHDPAGSTCMCNSLPRLWGT